MLSVNNPRNVSCVTPGDYGGIRQERVPPQVGALEMSPLDKTRANLKRLLAEATDLRDRLSKIEAEIQGEIEKAQAEFEQFVEQFGSFINRWSRGGEPTVVAEHMVESNKQDEHKVENSSEADNRFHGKGLSAAATLVVRTERRNMTLAEITRTLVQNGVKFAARKPEMSVDWALKRAAESGHVVKVGRGLWSAAFYGAAPQDELPERRDHSAITRAGLALAKERGVRLGPPPKLTEEHRLLAISLFQQEKTIIEIAKVCGISAAGLGRRIKEWREDGRFPARRPPKARKPKSEADNRELVH